MWGRYPSGVARGSILALERIRSHPLSRVVPLAPAIRWLGNHYVPWAARSAFHDSPHRVNGVMMIIPRPPLGGWGGEFHMALGTYEREELRAILSRLRPGDVFLDVGAHVGYFSLPAARRVGPGGRVIAVEPTPGSVEILRRNVELNELRWIEIIAAAASREDGVATLNLNNLSSMWNSIHPIRLGVTQSRVQVSTVAVDSLLAARGWPPVAGMKLDVEGAEGEVLEGAREALERNQGAFLSFEVCVSDPPRRERSSATLALLEAAGYRFRRIQRGGERGCFTARELLQDRSVANWRDALFNVIADKPLAVAS